MSVELLFCFLTSQLYQVVVIKVRVPTAKPTLFRFELHWIRSV